MPKTKTIYFDHLGILSNNERATNIFLILLGSFFIAILAQISIPLPFSPVPITGQTVGVILVGGILGSKRGALSILCYIYHFLANKKSMSLQHQIKKYLSTYQFDGFLCFIHVCSSQFDGDLG